MGDDGDVADLHDEIRGVARRFIEGGDGVAKEPLTGSRYYKYYNNIIYLYDICPARAGEIAGKTDTTLGKFWLNKRQGRQERTEKVEKDRPFRGGFLANFSTCREACRTAGRREA
jgi:hypothetical protein